MYFFKFILSALISFFNVHSTTQNDIKQPKKLNIREYNNSGANNAGPTPGTPGRGGWDRN